jgi:phospholipid/cholesterol/gamma-HCH transport system substrate-binding protein
MAKRKTKFIVGLFVAAGMGIALVAIIWLGMSRVFEKGRFYAVYFDESVQGLSVDAPVKYRGVTIGRVDRIGVAPDSRLIEVIMKVESGLKLEKDIEAQLRVVGITGSMFIELDRQTEGPSEQMLKLSFPTQYPVIRSQPSEISELFRGIDEIVDKMNSLDIVGISERIKSTLDTVNKQVAATDMEGISVKMKEALTRIDRTMADLDLVTISADMKRVLANLNEDLDPQRWHRLIEDLQAAIASFDQAVDNANGVLTNAATVVANTDAGVTNLNQHLVVVGQELETASQNLNRLLEQAADQPSQLFFGEPASPRFPEAGNR